MKWRQRQRAEKAPEARGGPGNKDTPAGVLEVDRGEEEKKEEEEEEVRRNRGAIYSLPNGCLPGGMRAVEKNNPEDFKAGSTTPRPTANALGKRKRCAGATTNKTSSLPTNGKRPESARVKDPKRTRCASEENKEHCHPYPTPQSRQETTP